MASPVVTASFDKAAYAPGDTIVLTIDHIDLDRYTLAVTGVVTDSQGNQGTFSTNAIVDEGSVQITDDGGKSWTLLTATTERTVFTATA